MKIALAQIKSVLADFEQNLAKHQEYINRAIDKKADLVIFPELSLTGYTLRDLTNEVAMRLDDARLAPLIDRSREIDIVFGLVEETNEFLYFNTAVYLSKGKIVHAHRKIYLPTYGMFEEGRHFATGTSLDTFNTKFGRSGMLVCEDEWHSICPLILTLKGALLVICVANGTARGIQYSDGIGSAGTWERMNTFYAGNHSIYLVFVNRVGVEDGVVFWGGSEIIDPFGERLIKGTYNNEELLFGDLDLDVVRRSRVKSPLLRDERIDFCLKELQHIWSLKRPEGENQ
jgi:predicted amidohydrolase